jgi:hypothetical protein
MGKIDFASMTSEEIRMKQLEISNHHESLKKIATEILEQLDLLEKEFDNGTKELNKRNI